MKHKHGARARAEVPLMVFETAALPPPASLCACCETCKRLVVPYKTRAGSCTLFLLPSLAICESGLANKSKVKAR